METKELKVEEIRAEAERNVKCPVKKGLYYMTAFISGPMCGRCLPCALGSYEAGERLRNLIEGRGKETDLLALRRIMNEMMEGSLCKKGKDTARFVLEWLSTGSYEEHIEGRCPAEECVSLMEYRIIPEKCVMCGICKEACSYRAIIGEKKTPCLSGFPPFEIKQRMCVKCGNCLDACAYGAIEILVRKVEVGV
ncbi:MAG: 4Fe-4S binding protein [Nitrospirae bacterium]|nr:4Fe-4S binding protein [Nitrospirota bacterium]